MHDEGFPGMLTSRRSQNEAQQVHRRGNHRYSQGTPEAGTTVPVYLKARGVKKTPAAVTQWQHPLPAEDAVPRGYSAELTHTAVIETSG